MWYEQMIINTKQGTPLVHPISERSVIGFNWSRHWNGIRWHHLCIGCLIVLIQGGMSPQRSLTWSLKIPVILTWDRIFSPVSATSTNQPNINDSFCLCCWVFASYLNPVRVVYYNFQHLGVIFQNLWCIFRGCMQIPPWVLIYTC